MLNVRLSTVTWLGFQASLGKNPRRTIGIRAKNSGEANAGIRENTFKSGGEGKSYPAALGAVGVYIKISLQRGRVNRAGNDTWVVGEDEKGFSREKTGRLR